MNGTGGSGFGFMVMIQFYLQFSLFLFSTEGYETVILSKLLVLPVLSVS